MIIVIIYENINKYITFDIYSQMYISQLLNNENLAVETNHHMIFRLGVHWMFAFTETFRIF